MAPWALFMTNNKYVMEHVKGFATPRRVERAYMRALTWMAETREVDGGLRCVGKSMTKFLSRADVVE